MSTHLDPAITEYQVLTLEGTSRATSSEKDYRLPFRKEDDIKHRLKLTSLSHTPKDDRSGIQPIDQHPYFRTDLEKRSVFILCPSEVHASPQYMSYGTRPGDTCITDSVLNIDYKLFREADDIDGEVQNIRVRNPKYYRYQRKKVSVRLKQYGRINLGFLSQNVKRDLIDTDILSKFDTVQISFRRSNSIVHDLLPTLTNDHTSGNNDVLYLPTKEILHSKEDYFWQSQAVASQLEISFDLEADNTKVLPQYDSEATKRELKDMLGENTFCIPTISSLHSEAYLIEDPDIRGKDHKIRQKDQRLKSSEKNSLLHNPLHFC